MRIAIHFSRMDLQLKKKKRKSVVEFPHGFECTKSVSPNMLCAVDNKCSSRSISFLINVLKHIKSMGNPIIVQKGILKTACDFLFVGKTFS